MSDALSSKVIAARLRWKRLKVFTGFCLLASVLLCLSIISFHTDRLIVLTSGGRLVWLLTLLIGLLSSAIAFVWLPAAKHISDEDVATEVERSYPGLKERLLTTVELAHAGASAGTSNTFV